MLAGVVAVTGWCQHPQAVHALEPQAHRTVSTYQGGIPTPWGTRDCGRTAGGPSVQQRAFIREPHSDRKKGPAVQTSALRHQTNYSAFMLWSLMQLSK